MWRAGSLEKTLMLRETEGGRTRGWQRMRWMASPTQWTWVWASSEIRWWTGRSGVLQSMGSQRVRHDWATELNLTWSNYSQGIPTTCWFWNQFYIDSTKGSWLNITMLSKPKPLTVWITINCGKLWKRWEYQTTWPASWETCVQVRKQQLKLDMEQQTDSK